jgi:hypothetical protein
MLQGLFYLTTALHVLGATITHLQEHKTAVTTVSGIRYTILLSAAIVEELELICVCACVCARMRVCVHMYVCACISVRTRTCVHACVFVCLCLSVCLSSCCLPP